ncbi:hypothetical protein K504DRAFT_453998 [Pleomassaria siparia CBS 279.74]|uniref:Uncharacterized protein n=1 Tax=Pleomassaria siparia CBS 279.74 TaxID=1314801 RepID=A0A6G1KDQ5_9PLEO|nr:hypothetical protein K504DRAFT_453998 [Pleomassaria siparia CBS 279.74]
MLFSRAVSKDTNAYIRVEEYYRITFLYKPTHISLRISIYYKSIYISPSIILIVINTYAVSKYTLQILIVLNILTINSSIIARPSKKQRRQNTKDNNNLRP